MVKNPLISIIVPVYKVEKFLDRCVESILRQSYGKLEVILVDDGSPDACPQLCDRWAEKDVRVKVIHKANGGLSDARNCGLEAATGDYVSFIDSDDYVSPDYAEYLLRLMRDNEADISCAWCRRVYGDGELFDDQPEEKTELYSSIEACRALMTSRADPLVMACGKLFPLDIVRANPFPVGRLHEDEASTYKYYYLAGKTVLGSREVYAYYQNEGSITHTKTRRNSEAMLLAYEEQCEYFRSMGCRELHIKAAERLLSTMVVYALWKDEVGLEFMRSGKPGEYLRLGLSAKTRLRYYGYLFFRIDLNQLYHKILGK